MHARQAYQALRPMVDELRTQVAGLAVQAPSSYVYRPGATGLQAPNVFTTWPPLMARMAGSPGEKFLVVDSSLVGFEAHVPAGSWNLSNVTIVAGQNSDLLVFDDGAIVTATIWKWANGISIGSNASSPIWQPTLANLLFVEQSVSSFAFGGKAPIVGVPAGVPFGHAPAILILDGALGDGTSEVLSVGAGSFCDCISLAGAVPSGAIGGGGTLNAFVDASSAFGSQTVSTLNLNLVDVSSFVAYTPATPANWALPRPTNVAAALDRLAAAVEGLLGHAIP